jgi:uncharacterized protein (TIGR02266 family)
MAEATRSGSFEHRVDPRVELRTEVRVAYPDRQSIVASLCRNISVGGMFIETELPPAPATVVRFEIDLEHFSEVVRGVGEVVWVKPSRGEGDRAGFGLRFLDIDPRQRQLIFRIVDRYVQRGGQPFDLDSGR